MTAKSKTVLYKPGDAGNKWHNPPGVIVDEGGCTEVRSSKVANKTIKTLLAWIEPNMGSGYLATLKSTTAFSFSLGKDESGKTKVFSTPAPTITTGEMYKEPPSKNSTKKRTVGEASCGDESGSQDGIESEPKRLKQVAVVTSASGGGAAPTGTSTSLPELGSVEVTISISSVDTIACAAIASKGLSKKTIPK